LSQEELAWRADLHRSYVADIERGVRNPSLESIHKLARALGVSAAVFFETTPPALAAIARRTGEILLVEDSPDDVELTLQTFKRARFSNRVRVVGDGAAALDFLFRRGAYARRKRNDLPQLVLLDLYLPKIHGLEVLRQMKRDPGTRAVPVVVLTVSQDHGDVEEARRLGAEAFLVKPVNFQDFSLITPALRFEWALVRG